MLRSLVVVLSLLTTAAFAQPQPPRPPDPPRAPMPPMGPGRMMFHGPPGIPPQLAAKLGISQDVLKKVKNATFDANEQLIGLQAEAQKKQLALQRVLSEDRVDEKVALARLEEVSRAELAVKKNRLSLMLRVRALLGFETWQKLQAEMPPFGPEAMEWHGMGPNGERIEKRIRIMRGGPGGPDVDVDERTGP